jgi:surface antigen
MKGAAVVAAAGGLVATLSAPASAETMSDTAAPVAAPPVAAPKAAAAVGPDAASVPAQAAAPALRSIGYAPAPKKAAKAEPIVIKDVVVLKERAEAREAAAAAKAAAAEKARREAAERASRDASRTSLTTSTYTRKTTANGTSGQKSAYNWATAGQCTWGALDKWYQSEGYYPGGWTGNAMAWGYGAANAGYTVSGTPRTRSIVVMQPGVHGSSSVGHVAWVTAVNGNEITMIEMNALAGPYNYNTRTVTHLGGMQYIYAP